ncbi:Acetyltransferase (GNAT) family protein [Corynebacterium occultum]|uniref:Acetyltransferase (GNAT) family protein n=1 Tax=Corynebacterium occultum TaxID=2675219 RepID=A0A6B8WBY1_9CORY|nr:GNAT family N-acetyltransferase [Corynebacterium occultum]QGU08366.1 Acetyltransferase (GNAT) family protein [Corynebacterium occultum]
MAGFFRSDPLKVGDRVVARRILPDTPGHLSDVIGHVLSVDPLVLRPQSVGGFPSQAPAIEIPAELLKIVKKLSPRRIRNSDIRAIETATAKAFPGIEHRWSGSGQWLLRAGDGVTERSNSAAPLGPSAGFDSVPLEEILDFYRSHQLPVRLLLPERLGNPALRMVSADGWELGPEIIIMHRDLALPPLIDDPGHLSFRIDEQPDEDWLDLYHFRGQPLPHRALELLRTRIDGQMGFGRLLTPAGETVAITRGTITAAENDRVFLGYSAVEVAPAWRRRGLGTRLGAEMLRWGAEHGADEAYLQVIATNLAGIGLYDKLGFVEHHRHRYAHLN